MPVILVTGAARGIGAAIVRRFADLNYEILFTYNRSKESAVQLESEIKSRTKVRMMQTDVSKENEVRALFEFCKTEFGRLDVLVNNASYSSTVGWDVKPIDINWAEWEKTIYVDLKGTMLCSHEAFQLMEPQK
jgi:3-oxoacyl-[acyl-carrier protein] reductase